MERYLNRHHAGKILAESLRQYAQKKDVIVLALPRGGVPVAYQIADTLNLPLDVFIVRKLGMPGHEELAMGAIASGGAIVLNSDVIKHAHVGSNELERVKAAEQKELLRREKAYRGNKPPLDLKNKTVILVDDGIATGATMRVAIEALRLHHPQQIIVAVPVSARDTAKEIGAQADALICLQTPRIFNAVGMFYEDFSQTEDEEVFDLLSKSKDL